jgi:hypothetical protein
MKKCWHDGNSAASCRQLPPPRGALPCRDPHPARSAARARALVNSAGTSSAAALHTIRRNGRAAAGRAAPRLAARLAGAARTHEDSMVLCILERRARGDGGVVVARAEPPCQQCERHKSVCATPRARRSGRLLQRWHGSHGTPRGARS